jgi:hypothetical protein
MHIFLLTRLQISAIFHFFPNSDNDLKTFSSFGVEIRSHSFEVNILEAGKPTMLSENNLLKKLTSF